MRLLPIFLVIAMLPTSVSAAEKRVITPSGGPAPVGPYSPGILAGDYLYVSGQGAGAAQKGLFKVAMNVPGFPY